MKNIHEFMEWAASHAVLRETGGKLFVDPAIIGKDPWKYLYGTTGIKATKELIAQKYYQYYKAWDWSLEDYSKATAGWAELGLTVCDCQGLEDAFSGSDTNAKGNFARYCSDGYKGLIKDIARPYVFGEALFCGSKPESITHVAWVIGLMPDGEPIIIHERGLAHGCVIERLSKSGKKFTYRGLMDKRYEYTEIAANVEVEDEPIDAPAVRDLFLRSPMLRGDDVRELQTALAKLGYNPGTIDGIFGGKTDAALRDYQTACGRMTQGICDETARKVLGL